MRGAICVKYKFVEAVIVASFALCVFCQPLDDSADCFSTFQKTAKHWGKKHRNSPSTDSQKFYQSGRISA